MTVSVLVTVAAEGAPSGADFYKGYHLFNGLGAPHALAAPPPLATSTPSDYKQKKGVRAPSSDSPSSPLPYPPHTRHPATR